MLVRQYLDQDAGQNLKPSPPKTSKYRGGWGKGVLEDDP